MRSFVEKLALAFVGGLGIGLALVLGGLHGQNQAVADEPAIPAEVRAHTFTLVDDAGHARARLEMANGQPCLTMHDTAQTERISLRLTKNGFPIFDLCDAAGTSRATLNLANADQPAVTLCDARGGARLELSSLKDLSGLYLFDARSAMRLSAGEEAGGRVGITVYDEKGRRTWANP